MKNSICISVAVLVCATCSAPARGQRLLERIAQPLLERLEEELQQQTVSRRIVAEGSATQQGYLGIIANDALEDGHGVRVLSVGAAGPADAGGIRTGDLIVSVRGIAVQNMIDLANVLRTSAPGERLDVEVSRDGHRMTMDVTLGPLAGSSPRLESQPRSRLGVHVTAITDELRQNRRLLIRRGAFIEAIDPGSPADHSGIPIGAVIVNFNGHRVDTPQDLVDMVRAVGPRAVVEIVYVNQGQVSQKSLQLSPIVVAPEPSIGADRPVLPSPSVEEELADGVERAFPQLPPVPAATPSLEELEESLDAAPPTQPVAASLEQRIGTLEEQLSQILDQLDKTSEELVRLRELLQSDDGG